MQLSRRKLILSSLASVASLGQIRQVALAEESPASRDILIFVFLRGGCDGLNLLAPVDDSRYKAARGMDTRISEKGSEQGLALTNGYPGFDFRIHPKAAALKELYEEKKLAFIHAAGVPNATRSHFDAQSLIERGSSEDNARAVRDGWLTRHLRSINSNGLIPVVAGTEALPDSLLGYGNSCCISAIDEFSFQGHWKYAAMQKDILKRAYTGNSIIEEAGQRTITVVNEIDKRLKRDKEGNIVPYRPHNHASYPSEDYASGLKRSLEVLATIIRMNVGLQVGLVDFDGWDTHQGQLYQFTNQVDALSRALHAFYTDLADAKQKVIVVVMSEFGRRFRQNKSYGTDHGHGSLMMVLGEAVNGGKMFGTWPGLAAEQLDQGADLKVTTDYRSVLSEVLTHRLGNPHIDLVFPGFKPSELGLVHKQV